jgi:hypothetical protein
MSWTAPAKFPIIRSGHAWALIISAALPVILFVVPIGCGYVLDAIFPNYLCARDLADQRYLFACDARGIHCHIPPGHNQSLLLQSASHRYVLYLLSAAFYIVVLIALGIYQMYRKSITGMRRACGWALLCLLVFLLSLRFWSAPLDAYESSFVEYLETDYEPALRAECSKTK